MKPLPNGVQAALDEALARTPEESAGLKLAGFVAQALLNANPIDAELYMAREYKRMDGPVEKYSKLELDTTEYVR